MLVDLRQAAQHEGAMLIYKVFRADEMATFLQEGETLGAPIDLADGYVHLSAGDNWKGHSPSTLQTKVI